MVRWPSSCIDAEADAEPGGGTGAANWGVHIESSVAAGEESLSSGERAAANSTDMKRPRSSTVLYMLPHGPMPS